MRRLLAIGFAVATVAAGGCKGKPSPQGDKDTPKVKISGGGALPDRSVAKVSALRIVQAERVVVIERGGLGWRLSEPVKGVADTTSAEMALREIERLELDTAPIATTKAEWQTYGVAPRDVVRLEVSVGTAAPFVLHLGKKGYVRVGADQNVYRAFHINYFTFARELRLWRARGLVSLTLAEVTDITISKAGRSAHANRADTAPGAKWTLVSGEAVVGTFNPVAPGAAVTRLASMMAYDVVDRSAPNMGLASPRVTAVVRQGDATHTLTIGATAGPVTYVAVDGKPGAFTVKNHAVAWLLQGPSAWGKP